MKKIIAISLITVGLMLTSFNITRSFFYPKAFFKGIKFKVGDFVSPPKVVLDQESIVTINGNIQIIWNEVEDYKNYSEPVYYRFSFLGREYKVNQNKYDLNLQGLTSGEYLYKIKACDQLNNCSSWSEGGNIIIPQLTLFGDSEKRGDKFLISNLNSTNQWSSNYLKLNIGNNYDILQMNLNYIINSKEILPGFDQAKLIITVNDKIIFLENTVSETWKNIQLNLSQFTGDPLEIKFYSGNQGDDMFSSWAEVKEIEFLAKLEEGVTSEESNTLSNQAKNLGIIF